MNKVLLALSFLSLGFLTTMGSIDPNNSTVWLASTDTSADILRSSAMFILVILMFTNPPRNVALRVLTGIGAISLTLWSGYATYQGQMLLFDGLALMAAGITAGIAVLEYISDKEAEEPIVLHNLPANLRSQLLNH